MTTDHVFIDQNMNSLGHWETLGPETDPAPKEGSDHVTN